MEALFYLCSVMGRDARQTDGNGRKLLNGCLCVGTFFGVILLSLLRLIETYVYDIGGALATCCSFGPINPKNPFSSKAIAFTYVVLPVAGLMTVLFGRLVRRHLHRIESEYVVSNVACLLFMFVVVLSAPLGAQGNGMTPLAVLAGQAVAYTSFSLWLHFQRVHPSDVTESRTNDMQR